MSPQSPCCLDYAFESELLLVDDHAIIIHCTPMRDISCL